LECYPAPGFTSLNTGRIAWIAALSWTGPGECNAGGYYTVRAGTARKKRAFVVSEVRGRWLRARVRRYPRRAVRGAVMPEAIEARRSPGCQGAPNVRRSTHLTWCPARSLKC